MRHGLDGLHAAARGNRPHAEREVRARPGDPRALPANRPTVQALRQRAVPHPGALADVAREAAPLADPHRSRRRVHGAVRRPGHRSAARPQASGHRGDRVVPGALLPHQPVGLRVHGWRRGRRAHEQTGRQARRDDRHGGHGGAVRAASGQRLQGALRVPAHAVVGRRARQRADRSRLVRRHRDARLAAALARELHRESGRRHCRGRPRAGRLDRSGPTDPRADRQVAAFGTHGSEDAGRVRGCRLREDGGDPRAGRRDRARTRDGRETQGLVPAAVQAPLLPRRLPAGVQ